MLVGSVEGMWTFRGIRSCDLDDKIIETDSWYVMLENSDEFDSFCFVDMAGLFNCKAQS